MEGLGSHLGWHGGVTGIVLVLLLASWRFLRFFVAPKRVYERHLGRFLNDIKANWHNLFPKVEPNRFNNLPKQQPNA